MTLPSRLEKHPRVCEISTKFRIIYFIYCALPSTRKYGIMRLTEDLSDTTVGRYQWFYLFIYIRPFDIYYTSFAYFNYMAIIWNATTTSEQAQRKKKETHSFIITGNFSSCASGCCRNCVLFHVVIAAIIAKNYRGEILLISSTHDNII